MKKVRSESWGPQDPEKIVQLTCFAHLRNSWFCQKATGLSYEISKHLQISKSFNWTCFKGWLNSWFCQSTAAFARWKQPFSVTIPKIHLSSIWFK
jgi:hypothetical protein